MAKAKSKSNELVELVNQARLLGAGYAITWSQPRPRSDEKPEVVSIALFNVAGVAPWPMPAEAAGNVLRQLVKSGQTGAAK